MEQRWCMTIPFWCLFVAVCLPYVWGGISTGFRKKDFGSLDNHHPRAQAQKLTGPGARAYAAQSNAWEALAVFAPAVIVAHLGAPASPLAPTLAIVWLVCRVLHGIVYVADLAPVRTGLFAVGFASALGLFLVGAGVL
jgi:uncharacterized MAPEG superfamily protein